LRIVFSETPQASAAARAERYADIGRHDVGLPVKDPSERA
jgi:hypothetical protein